MSKFLNSKIILTSELFNSKSIAYIFMRFIQQQLISVRMELKRNFNSNIQPPTQIKGSHIINPLIQISNASTPVRTRIIKPGSQLNSTPVNVHKIGMPAKSPALSNKQNDQGNGRVHANKPKISQQNINLSPIMALNRKMSEGPKLQQRTFTPTGFKRQQSMQNINQNHNNHNFGNQQYFTQNLQESRNSNSFRHMIESRSKSPTRIAFAQTLQRQNSQGNNFGLMRTSGSAANVLQGIGTKLRQSRNVKLTQSRSFQQLINLGTPLVKQNQVLCSNSNDHQKKVKAKYKVVQQPDDEQLLVYCSKCAINLVQKGFKVEDLTNEDIERIKQNKKKSLGSMGTGNYNSQQQRQQNQYYDYADETCRKIRFKLNELQLQKQNHKSLYQKQLQDIDCYYNSMIETIQRQRARDRETIMKIRQKEKKAGNNLQKKLSDALNQLTHMTRGGHVGSNQLRNIQQMQSLLTEKGFGCRFDGNLCLVQNVQSKFNYFSQYFQMQGRLKLQGQQQREQNYNQNHYTHNQFQYFSNKQPAQKGGDCALRFSFQKNIKQTMKQNKKNNQFGLRCGGMMNALEEAPQALQGQDSNQYSHHGNQRNQKKAFRTLFPQQDQFEENKQGEKQGIHSPTFKQI